MRAIECDGWYWIFFLLDIPVVMWWFTLEWGWSSLNNITLEENQMEEREYELGFISVLKLDQKSISNSISSKLKYLSSIKETYQIT